MDRPADSQEREVPSNARTSLTRNIFAFPWWLAILILLGIYIVTLVTGNEMFRKIFAQIRDGIAMTLTVSFLAYAVALVFGLIIGLIRANPPARSGRGLPGLIFSLIRLVVYNAATLYVQVLRGLPILVTLLIVAFVIIPQVNNFTRTVLNIDLGLKGSSVPSAIVALAFTYAAFESETFRAGIQSVQRGQIEAARSLGMNYFQLMRFIVLPQAIRIILPPLGNDLISMLKDSSLVAILGIGDITQLAKLSAAASFRYLETYLIAAAVYLTITTIGSILVRFLERRMAIATR